MKVRSDRVLEKLGQKISCQQQEHREVKVFRRGRVRPLPKYDRFWKDLEESDREHKPGTQCQKVFQVPSISRTAHYREKYETAQYIRRGRDQCKGPKLYERRVHTIANTRLYRNCTEKGMWPSIIPPSFYRWVRI